jgi:hypothetical protein
MMTPEEALQYQKELMDEALTIVERKRHDYSGGEDPFRNFRATTAVAGVETWRGVLVRLADKLSRIRSIMDAGGVRAVENETLRDTICDAINYVCILGCLIEEELHVNNEDS